MISPALNMPGASDFAPICIALSSIELSAVRFLQFDPDAALAVRQGAYINTVDDDDSGAIRHIVPISAYPEAVWRVAASAITNLSDTAETRPLIELYAARLIFPSASEPQFYRLDPLELAAGLRADHPDAYDHDNAIAARIHTLEALKGANDPSIPVHLDELTDTGWLAAVEAMPIPADTRLWSPALLRLRRAIAGSDAVEERAWWTISELHSAICVLHEAPFGVGLDFATYLTDLIGRLRGDPVSTAQLQAATGPDLDMVRHAIASGDGAAFLASL